MTAVAPATPSLGRVARVRGHLGLHTIVILLMVVWAIPTIGLLINSFRPAAEQTASGWWTAIFPRTSSPSRTTPTSWPSRASGRTS